MSEPHRSNDVTLNINRAGVVLAVMVGLFGLLGAWFVLPYRVQAAERKIEAIEREQATMREILIRIDENVKTLKEARK